MLQLGQFVIVLQFVFLHIKSVENHTDEEIENEKEAEDHKDDEEEDVFGPVVELWNLMYLGSIDGEPHNCIPSFSRHHGEHGEHGAAHIIKMRVVQQPLATIVVAVPL